MPKSKDTATTQYNVGDVRVSDRYDGSKGVVSHFRELTLTDPHGHQTKVHYHCDSDYSEQQALASGLSDLDKQCKSK